MTALDVLLGGLALWRACSLISYEKGPWGVFMRLRHRAHVDMYDSGEPTIQVQPGYLAELLSCTWCLSMALALPYVALYLLFPTPARVLSLPFAISAVAIIVERVNRG